MCIIIIIIIITESSFVHHRVKIRHLLQIYTMVLLPRPTNAVYIYIYIYTHTHTHTHKTIFCGPGSSVGIATELRAGRSGIESRCGRDFPAVQNGPGAHLTSCKTGTGSFLGVKCGRGVLLTPTPS